MSRIYSVWCRRIAGGTIAIALACGDSDLPTLDTGSIQVAVNPASLSVPQGGNGSVTVSVTRGGGYAADITLSVSGLPAGVSTTINPAQLTGSTTSATIDVAVAATVALGSYTATVTAAGQGVAQATTSYQLTVTAAPNYALTVSPASLTVAAGTSGNAVVNISRTNFTGGVTLSLQNPPAGITATFNPSPSTTNSSDLVLSVAATVAAADYALTIQGSATGITTRTVALQVTVTSPPSGGNNVEYQFCGGPTEAPVFFAFQDGANAWQAVAPVTSGTVTKFAFNITHGHGGVILVFQTAAASTVANALQVGRSETAQRRHDRRARLRGFERRDADVARLTSISGRSFADLYETGVLYATTAELAQDASAYCEPTETTKTITGVAAGVPTGSWGFVSFGHTTEIFEGSASTTPLTFDVPNGPRDLAGARMATPGTPPNKLILFRNLNIPDLGSLPSTIDFSGPAALTPVSANLTISGASGDTLEAYVVLVTANNVVGIYSDFAPSPTATRPWAGLNATDMLSTDFHGLIVFANGPNEDLRVTGKYVGPVSNQSIAFGPALASTATPIGAGTYPRFRFQGALATEYNKVLAIDIAPTMPGNTYGIAATSAYLTATGSALSYNLTMPDVTSLPGFPIAARLAVGANDLSITAHGFTGQGAFYSSPTLGGEFKTAVRKTSITVP